MNEQEMARAEYLERALPPIKGGSIDVITGDALERPPSTGATFDDFRAVAAHALAKFEDFNADEVLERANRHLEELRREQSCEPSSALTDSNAPPDSTVPPDD